MVSLIYTIASTKRKLAEASNKLDEVYKDIQDDIKRQAEELEKQYRDFDKDKLVLKITQRMVYLNRAFKPSVIEEARLDELAKILDYLGE